MQEHLISWFQDFQTYCSGFNEQWWHRQELSVVGTSFLLIFAAELGDKSQLVCMTLAGRHRAKPIFWGALSAFALLNGLAVIFGSVIASWVPVHWISALVSGLFLFFGVQAILAQEGEEEEINAEKTTHGIFLSTLLIITLAEFGDKTQLAVVALSSTASALAVWIGSTLALATTSALGIVAGRSLVKNIPLVFIHRISGAIFILLSIAAGYKSYLAISRLAY